LNPNSDKEKVLTLKTQKASSQGWNAAPSRCDAAASVTTLSNSSSHAASASPRVRLRLTAARRSEPSADALGPFHLTSAATALGGAAPAASRSGEAGSAAAAGGGSGSPSARRTTRRTRNLRAAGGRGHSIILATISGQKSTTSTKPTSTLENAVPKPNQRGGRSLGLGPGGARSDGGEVGPRRRGGVGFEALRERTRAWGWGADAREEREVELRNK